MIATDLHLLIEGRARRRRRDNEALTNHSAAFNGTTFLNHFRSVHSESEYRSAVVVGCVDCSLFTIQSYTAEVQYESHSAQTLSFVFNNIECDCM